MAGVDFATLWKMPTWREDVREYGPCLEHYENYTKDAVGCPDLKKTGTLTQPRHPDAHS